MKASIDVDIRGMNRDQAMNYAKEPKNAPIVAIPVLLVFSFIFYVLAGFFSYMGAGTTPSAVEQSLLSGVTDSNAADTFQKIQMAMRIMPSHKTEGNMLIMVPETGSAEWQGEYDDGFEGNISEDYFTTDNMEDYFPEMLFTENTVPLGNAKPFCLHLDWSTKANRKILDKYYSVQDLPICQLAQNPKFRWQETDPKNGLDFSLWRQYSHKAGSKDDCDSESIFVRSIKNDGSGTCYKYQVLESVCVGVSFKIDEETATYGWAYEGGCFVDGRIANYKAAVPGTEYNFDKLDFEIREYDLSIGERLSSIFSLSGLFGLLATLCIIGAIIAAIVLIVRFAQQRREVQALQGGSEVAGGGQVEMASVKDKQRHQILEDER